MILAVVGPTGVGKTKLSIKLAQIYNGEIINADSMQIYKGLDVGTAKVTKEEMENIPHHLLSIKDVTENYTVYDYQKDARDAISEIKSRGKVPIFVGGTGYYLKAALYDYEFTPNNKDAESNLTNEELRTKIDSFGFNIAYDINNRPRLINLLNRLENGWEPNDKNFTLIYDDVLFIGLTTSREILYQKISERFDKMLVPLIDEVKPYFLNKVEAKPLKLGIGYKEFLPFFENKQTLSEVVNNIKKNSCNYAKRQYTWFQNQMDIKWFRVDYNNFSDTINSVVEYIEGETSAKN